MARGPNKNVCAQCGARVDAVVWQQQLPGQVFWCWPCHRRARADAVVVVPMLPGQACSPNGGWGWRARSAARAELRACAHLAAIGALNANEGPLARFVGHAGPITLDAEIRWCCGRKRMDDDNAKASLKGALDGLSDALWSGEDKHVRIGEVRQSRGDGSVTFLLRALEGS